MTEVPQRLLVDVDVVLDLLMGREPFVMDALQIFTLAEAGQVELLLSTGAISTILHVIQENQGAMAVREALAKMLDYVTLAAPDERAVVRGAALNFPDVENAFSAVVAEKEGATCILTRNVPGFKGSPVPAVNPKVYLASVAARKRAQ